MVRPRTTDLCCPLLSDSETDRPLTEKIDYLNSIVTIRLGRCGTALMLQGIDQVDTDLLAATADPFAPSPPPPSSESALIKKLNRMVAAMVELYAKQSLQWRHHNLHNLRGASST
jgi:hypothetical protein